MSNGDDPEFPQGWIAAKLGAGLVESVQPGFACGAHNRGGDGVAHLRPMNVSSDGKIELSDVKFVPVSEVNRNERWISEGDVLFNRTNSPELVGKTAYYDEIERRAFSNHMTRVRCREDILEPQYCAMALHHLWQIGHFQAVCNNHVSQASISRSVLLDTEIPLPPLAEQRRIVEKVETLLARVQSARQRLARVPLILKRFRQAVLTAACNGQLTADWRDKQSLNDEWHEDLPVSWCWKRFGDLIATIRSGTTAVPQNESTDYPVLRSSSVRPGATDLEDVKFLDESKSTNDANYLADGDLLFTRLSGSIEYVANCAIVRGLNGRRIQFPDRLFCARLMDPAHARYAEYAFASQIVRRRIEDLAKSSAGHQRISISGVTDQYIPLPPLAEQHEIVRRVDALFRLADAIERRVAAATARADKLTQAILAKAFRGELVPTEDELAQTEGREYESAEQLLARLSQSHHAESELGSSANGSPRRAKRKRVSSHD